jgi:hypothetical protein
MDLSTAVSNLPREMRERIDYFCWRIDFDACMRELVSCAKQIQCNEYLRGNYDVTGCHQLLMIDAIRWMETRRATELVSKRERWEMELTLPPVHERVASLMESLRSFGCPFETDPKWREALESHVRDMLGVPPVELCPKFVRR